MTQPFSLTADKVQPAEGLYAYIPNLPQQHNAIFYSGTSTDKAHAGQVMALYTSSTNAVAPEVVACATTDVAPFGIVVYDCRLPEYAVGDKIALAKEGDVIYMIAGGTVAVGDELTFNASTRKVTKGAGSTTTIGTALTPASSNGFVQVAIKFNTYITPST